MGIGILGNHILIPCGLRTQIPSPDHGELKYGSPYSPYPSPCSAVDPDEQNQVHFTVNMTAFEHKKYLII